MRGVAAETKRRKLSSASSPGSQNLENFRRWGWNTPACGKRRRSGTHRLCDKWFWAITAKKAQKLVAREGAEGGGQEGHGDSTARRSGGASTDLHYLAGAKFCFFVNIIVFKIWFVFGRIGTYFSKYICILQHFLWFKTVIQLNL